MTYQLPPGIANFVNRADEQERALRAAAQWCEPDRPLVIALSGPGGTGKTELAFRIARALSDDRPHVLSLDLDDLRREGAVDPVDAQGQLLLALGVESRCLEQSPRARARQYWQRTRDKRPLLVVDNVRYATELHPLLPASGAGVVIVASHGPLYDLEGGAALELPLAPLSDEHATELLHRLVGDPRPAAEPEAVRGFVRLCSGLPAALQVAGRLMRARPRRPLARLLETLTAELDDKGLPMVEKVWDAAYRELSREAALLYRLLPQHPGPSLSLPGAAALLGLGPDAAEEALDALEAVGLAQIRDGRLRLHELLRAHAGRCARRDGGAREHIEARRAMVLWYLRQAQRADALAAGRRLTLAAPVPALPAPDVPLSGPAAAYDWLETERHTLHGCVTLAHAGQLDDAAWALCEPLWTHYLDHPHHAEVIDSFRIGRDAAQRAGRVAALARMRCQLARPLWERGRFAEAGRELEAAVNARQALGSSEAERKLSASVTEFRGMLRSAQGDWAGAATDFEESRAAHQAMGNDYGVLLQTHRLGQAAAALGDPARAADLLTRAHRAARDLGRERMTARTGFELALVLRRLGRTEEAHRLCTSALAAARARGSGFDEARVLDALAELAEDTGDTDTAREHRATARAVRERCGALMGPGAP
ncbi:hypothetical protein ACIHFE_08980 [Streptomyces sp. NPDC052396]|uniref:hypothetical protein n=1 Tax=Streptomyces sp. NPDC052396 TaxID=3365689 RepID=UPI0037CD4EE1